MSHPEKNTLPYREIPAHDSSYEAGSVIARMIDGLGYRYYWATEALRAEDLAYTPEGEDSRSSLETLKHIHGLSETIYLVSQQQPIERPAPASPEELGELRKQTLENLQQASEAFLHKSAKELEEYQLVFKQGEKEYPYLLWNLINGQIADAIYHTGQVVSYRRSSGNPIPSGVNVFLGKTRE